MTVAQFDLTFLGTAGATYVTAAGTTLIGKAPAAARGGGITILEAWSEFRAGTAPLTLVDLGADGATLSGTACSITGVHTAAAPVSSGSPAGYFLQAGRYLGVVLAAGTVTVPGGVHVLYTQGRGGA